MSEEKRKLTPDEKREQMLALQSQVVRGMEELYGADPELMYSYLTGGWTLRGETYGRANVLTLISGLMPDVSERMLKVAMLKLEMKQAEIALQRRMAQAEVLGARAGEEDDSALRQWYWALTGNKSGTVEVEADLWALKQVMWQVLRNAMQRPVKWQIVCVLWSSKQGTGKSFMLDRLFGSWRADTLTLRAYQLSQDFFAPVISRSLVLVLDEFAGPGEGEEKLGIWKSYLTADRVMRRRMYEDTCFEAHNRTTAVATSNLPPPHHVKDSSGGRRQWSIHAKEESILDDPQRAQVARELSVSNIWKAVSADVECLHDTIPLNVRRYMDNMRDSAWRKRSPIESWYRSCTVESAGDEIVMDKLWRAGVNHYAGANRLGEIEGEAREIRSQLEAIGARTKNSSGRITILDRRSIVEDWPQSPKLHVVKKRA